MNRGQYNSLGLHCGPHTASSEFLLLLIIPVQLEILPVPISQFYDNFIRKSGSENTQKFTANIAIFCILESENLQFEQAKSPVFWQNFQISCVFPDKEFFWQFSLFSLLLDV